MTNLPPMRCLIIAGLLPLLAAAPAPSPEQAELEKLQWAGQLGSDRAERLAHLIIRDGSRSRAEEARRQEQVRGALAAFRADVEAIRARRWKPEWSRDDLLREARAAKAPELKELFERAFLDQWQLHFDGRLDETGSRALRALAEPEIRTNIRDNTSWLKAVLARIGWFDVTRYGANASRTAWLLLQHSDHDPAFQERMLVDLEPRMRRGDMEPRSYAYLVDRVAHNAGRPQTYGTQGRCVGPGDWQPFDTIELAGLDERRLAVGLEPMSEYRAVYTCK